MQVLWELHAMKNHSIRLLSLVVLFASWSLSNQASAIFHFMQIEQVIGGVNGDTTAQAIQLRMRSNFQNEVQFSRLIALDATGFNPIVLIDNMMSVAGNQGGDRVLITTASFGDYTDITLQSDFTFINPIPTSYLSAGQIAFQNIAGTLDYWLLSFGGASFTGSTSANTGANNDDDGDYGPPVDGPLPSNSLSALLFQGTFGAKSTTNFDDYDLTAGAATFTNNAGVEFTLVEPGDFDFNGIVDGEDFLLWQRDPSIGSLADWKANYGLGTPPLSASSAAVPEPTASALALAALCLVMSRRRYF